MKTLGLVTGLGMGAGIFYYQKLVEAHRAMGLTFQIIMTHADAQKVTGLSSRRESHELALYLAGLLEQLRKGGADIGCIPAFAPSICETELKKVAPLPLLSPLDVIAEKVRQSNRKRCTILGARVTMETNLFGRLTEVDIVRLSRDDLDTAAVIYRQIVDDGKPSKEQFRALRDIAHRAIAAGGAELVILAGTDLSLVFNEANTDFPHVHGAQVHISALINALQ
jgi:aspartate racemase